MPGQFNVIVMDHHLVIMPTPIQLSTITQPQQIPLQSRGFQNVTPKNHQPLCHSRYKPLQGLMRPGYSPVLITRECHIRPANCNGVGLREHDATLTQAHAPSTKPLSSQELHGDAFPGQHAIPKRFLQTPRRNFAFCII